MGILGIISLVRGNWSLFLIGGMGAIILALWFTIQIQSGRIERSNEKINNLETEISGMKSANILTKRLRKDNAELTRELNDMGKGIDAIEGASQPLPDDVRRILERLRERNAAGAPLPR